MNTFKELGLKDNLLRSIEKLGFSQPTKIQKDSIPLILEGKDVIGESETGSGKTLAFGCGIVEKCSRDEGIQALILTPTRELAEQVKDSLKEITYKPRLNIIAVFGGVSIYNQIKNLKRTNVVVATPGRLLDHVNRGTIDLRNLKILVMDEADRMFDMGFIDDVNKIIKICPEERQTLFFSATISKDVKRLANRHMVNPEIVHAGNVVDPTKLKQVSIKVAKSKKFSLLTHLLKEEDKPLAMVFCNTRNLSDFVDKNLRSNGIKTAAIHGGLSQNARLKAIDRFNAHQVNVLVCTDVAARGLHIKNVSHVINYDLPKDPNDYIHRIGRTARAGESGQVINILTNFDKNTMIKIKKYNKDFTISNMEVDDFKEIDISKSYKAEFNGGGGRVKRDHSERPRSGQTPKFKDGGKRNYQEKNKNWQSSKKKEEYDYPKPADYKTRPEYKKGKFTDNKPKSNEYKPKTGGHKPKSNDYKPRSNGYEPKSDGHNSKPGTYKGVSDGYGSKSGGYKGKSNGNSGGYKGKSNGYKGKSGNNHSKSGGYKGKTDGYKPRSGGTYKSKTGGKPKSGGDYKNKSGGYQDSRHHK